VECSPPPFERDNIKYNVGDPTVTVINLLDWDTVNKGPSPLSNSKGWVDTTVVPSADGLECTLANNPFISILNADPALGCVLPAGTTPITSNGMPVTNGFDLSIYVKGDKKSVAIYNAKLEIEYELPPVVCGEPVWSKNTDNAMIVWNDCADLQQWHMRAVRAGATQTVFKGSITSDFGFLSLIGVSLENDIVTPTPPVTTYFAGPVTYTLGVYPTAYDGVDFRVGADATGSYDGCFGMTAPTDAPVLVGATRVPVPVPFSLATFKACTP
jgi:hypothetical protein